MRPPTRDPHDGDDKDKDSAEASGPANGRRPPGNRTTGKFAAAAVAVAAVLGVWLLHDGSTSTAPPAPSADDGFTGASPSGGASASPSPSPSPTRTVPPMAYSPPTRVRIPTLKIDAPVMRLGLDKAGHLNAPPADNKNLTGWYAGGPAPGAAGPAIVAGHVDNRSGPAVFWGLGSLHKGATVQVRRADGSRAVFTVDAIEVYGKQSFPDKKVYQGSDRPELRIITCGGGFSKSKGYLGNVVVYSHLTKTVAAPHASPSGSPSKPVTASPSKPGAPAPTAGPSSPAAAKPGAGKPSGQVPSGVPGTAQTRRAPHPPPPRPSASPSRPAPAPPAPPAPSADTAP